MVEWLKASDCRSDGANLRWFKSICQHTGRLSVRFKKKKDKSLIMICTYSPKKYLEDWGEGYASRAWFEKHPPVQIDNWKIGWKNVCLSRLIGNAPELKILWIPVQIRGQVLSRQHGRMVKADDCKSSFCWFDPNCCLQNFF